MNASAEAASDYRRVIAQCHDCDYTIDWWSRGGEPGPGYTSDKLTVTANGGFVRATYVRARFDPAFEGNFRALEHTAPLNRREADALLRALDADQLFARHFDAEDRTDLADGIKDTVRVELRDRRFEKTLVEVLPDHLSAAIAVRNALVKEVTQQSQGRDLNRRLR